MFAPFCKSVSSSPWNFFGISTQIRLVPSVTRILSFFIRYNPLLGRRSVFGMRPAAIMMSLPSIFCLTEVVRTVTAAIDARRKITRQSLQKMPSTALAVGVRKRPTRLAPKKISIARLRVTGSDVFGREEDIALLDRAWANKDVNVVTMVAWTGVGFLVCGERLGRHGHHARAEVITISIANRAKSEPRFA